MNYDDNYEDEAFQTLRHFALVGLRNLNIQNRLIISYIISTIFPLLFVYLYSYYLYGSSVVTGQLLVLSILIAGIALTMTTYTYLSISSPIQHMIETCQNISDGNLDVRIQDKGNDELAYLSDNIDSMVTEIQLLLEQRQESDARKRELELKMLQYQINPHFLYNTLESITWMVEAQENEGAVRMISELAKLLRVSLSRGKTIISIKDELQHSRSYMNIQLARYKERFKTEFRIEKEIENYCIVKLVIQPILENAIYYGVGNMDEDEDGRIIVSGEKKEEDILITIEDNGMGMPEEVLEKILTDNSKVPKHGSGVGVINVHSRIRLMFGEKYGLSIESEPDEGTRVTIRIPAIPYTPENAERLESQKYIQRRSADEKESG